MIGENCDFLKMIPEVTDLWTCDFTIYRTKIPAHCWCKENNERKTTIFSIIRWFSVQQQI